MKKLVIAGLMLIFSRQVSAQYTFDGTTDSLLLFSGGMHQLIIPNTAFNAWTAKNYNKRIGNPLAANIEVTLINLKNYDIGGSFSWNNVYSYGGGFIGRRLTKRQAAISSWLNIDAGAFYGNFKNWVPPVNYMLTPDQVGQKLELHYMGTYIGLTSKNYLNKAPIRIGKRRGFIFIPSVYFSAAYMPFRNNSWNYGYYYTNPQDTSRHFRKVGIKTIPLLSKAYFNAGISIALAVKQ